MKNPFKYCFKKRRLIRKLMDRNAELTNKIEFLKIKSINDKESYSIDFANYKNEIRTLRQKLLKYEIKEIEPNKVLIKLRESIKKVLLDKVSEINTEINELYKRKF